MKWWKEQETTLLKKNSIQDSLGNDENVYPVADLNKTISVTKEQSNDLITKRQQQQKLKEEIWEKFSEKFMEKIWRKY
jgi:hypothetical protein